MSYNIIDKNPRKPRKEGKKAQEKYVEGLRNDWDRDMVKEQAEENARKRAKHGPGPDAATRERYRIQELKTLEVIEREAKRAADAKKRFVARQSGLIVPGKYGSA